MQGFLVSFKSSEKVDRKFVDLMDNLAGYPQAPQILLLRLLPDSHRLGAFSRFFNYLDFYT